jgi:tRNA acetyltransferase TAN1
MTLAMAFSIIPGMSGILVTCNRGKEALCVREMYDMLSDYFQEDDVQQGEDGDIERALESEVNMLKSKKNKRFLSMNIGKDMSCLVFIRLFDCDPVALCESIFGAQITRCIKSTQRLIPLQATAYANVKDFSKMAQSVLKEHLVDKFSDSQSFAVVAESRMNNSLDKRVAIELIGEILAPCGFKVNLKHPDIVVMVQIMKNLCGISVIPGYYEKRKMNIQI